MASANTGNPQTFNRYTYGLNNPYKYTDPSGMNPTSLDDETNAAFAQLGALADYADALRQAEEEAQERQQAQQQPNTNPYARTTGNPAVAPVITMTVTADG